MRMKYRYYAANLLVIWLFIFIYRTHHYYVKFLSAPTQIVLVSLAAAYTAGGFIYYRLAARPSPSHAYEALTAIRRWLGQTRVYLAKFPYEKNLPAPTVTKQEKNALLFLLVKIIYLPMMTNFFLGNINSARQHLSPFLTGQYPANIEALHLLLFPLLIDLIFIIDSGLYATGYALEAARCKNLVKSVEPSVLGWAVTLACYPPFNGFVNTYVLWSSLDIPLFKNLWLTVLAEIAMLLCFTVYVWGSITLGWKCSNLTNRGIVMTGAFAYVRHPAYISKNLAWWIAMLPIVSVPAILTMSFWSFIYFVRAITEERHLLQDPDYQEYCKKVPYRFIPYVY